MFNVRLAIYFLHREMAVQLAVACDVFDCVLFLCSPFSHEMSWMRSGTE